MKTLIFSDIHGNLPALEKTINKTKKVDRYIILGDVVNYGPWSNECVQLIETLKNCIKIKGNHDVNFINKKNSYKDQLSQKFFQACFEEFKEFESLKHYIDEYYENNTKYMHTIDNKYIFQDTKININYNYFIGHSHRQFLIKKDDYIIVNPGSVGQNREFINEINYLIYDSNSKKIDFKSIIYNVNLLIDQMRIKKFPKECIEYYSNKKRK